MKKNTLLLTLLLFLTSEISAQNRALSLNTNDFVQTTFSSISGNSSRTVEAWIKTTANCVPNAGGVQQTIVDWGTFLTGQRFTVNLLWANALRIEVGGNGLSGSIPVNDGVWHHVAVVYNSSLTANQYSLYVDGVLDVSGNLTVATNTGTSVPLRIGQRVDGVNTFNGEIDEVRIWNVARTQAEIAASMNSEFCSPPSALKAYYTMNHGTAGGTNTTVTTVTDYSGANNTGTLTGFSLSGTTSNWVTGKNIFPVAINSTFPITACGSYTMPNGTIITTAGIYYDTISSSVSCDSLDSYVITITSSMVQNIVSDSGCITYTTPMGTLITSSGTYYDTVAASTGCDTLIQYDIVISGAVDDSVYRVGGRITSFDTWASHQWVRCDSGYAPISGETGRFINATTPGDYAVIVTRGSCIDTSDCINISLISIMENENNLNFLTQIICLYILLL